MGNFMGYNSATELFTAIGNKIKAKYTKPSGGIPKRDLASGVQTSLDQISTNQANITYAINTGAKNLLGYDIDQLKTINTLGSWDGNTYTFNGVTYVLNDDMTVTVTAGNTHAYAYLVLCNQNYDMGNRKRFLANSPLYLTGGISDGITVSVYSPTGGSNSTTSTGNTDTSVTYTNLANNYNVSIGVGENISADVTIKPMLRSQSVSDSTYQPYALPNHDLTSLEAEDRASLVRVVNNGAKNVFDPNDITESKTQSRLGITATLMSDGSVKLSGTPSSANTSITFTLIVNIGSNLKKYNGYYLLGTVDNTTNISYYAFAFELSGSPYTGYGVSENGELSPSAVSVPNTTDYITVFVRIKCANTTTAINTTFRTMICTKAEYGVSPTYEPPALGNQYLTPALVDQVDSGAKNQWDPSKVTKTHSHNGVTFTLSNDGVITANGTATGGDAVFGDIGSGAYKANKILYIEGSINSEYANRWFFDVYDDGWKNREMCYSAGKVIYKETKPTIGIWRLIIPNNVTCDNATFKPMVCDLADWKVSQKYVPYRVPITGLMSVVDKDVACSTTLTTTGIKFTATEKAAYRITATAIYYNSIPMKLAIKYKISSSSNQGTFSITTHVDGEDVSLTVSGIRLLDVGGEFEIFAQYASPTNNRFYVLVEKIG